ncbi:PilN domain-containing protein, partial [candidate division TA06 bacterium]|nr:PilN domain-containing protein [candidate division TA06 bacterium]
GASNSFPLIQNIVSAQLTLPLEIIDFKQHCPLDPDLAKEGMGEKISFASGVGFLLKDAKRINLIPSLEKKARADRRLRRTVTQFVSLLVGSLVLVGLIFGNALHRQHQKLLFLQERLQALEPKALEIGTMQRQIVFFENREAESEVVLEILRELSRLTPEETSLTYLAIESDRLSLRGGAKNLPTVFRFTKALESSPFLKSVRMKNATRRILSEGEMTIFRIDALVVQKEERKL